MHMHAATHTIITEPRITFAAHAVPLGWPGLRIYRECAGRFITLDLLTLRRRFLLTARIAS